MKLKKSEVTLVENYSFVLQRKNTNWRRGQSFFNALFIMFPEVAESIRATEYDPFYNDDIIDKCKVKITMK
jgi:hypothetical protein